MKLEVLQEDLAEALKIASRFVNPRAQLPILSNIVLDAQKTKLFLLATNLEMSIAASVGAKVEKTGKIAVPSKTVVDIINNLPSEPVKLSVTAEEAKISSTGFNGKVAGMNTSDFPDLPQSIKDKSIEIQKETLNDALSRTMYAASIDETRPILTGLLFVFSGKKLMIVATDGFRLSQATIPLKTEQKEQKVIIPKNSLVELSRASDGPGESVLVDIDTSNNQIVFGMNNLILSSRILEGEFPNFEKIIPKETKITVNVDREEFLRAIRLASVFARESANIIKLNVGKSSLEVSAESARSGSQKAKVDAKVDGGELSISYNYRFIEEFLNSCESDDVTLKFSDTTSPGIFLDPKDNNYLHLIMPVRVQE